ncbi:hypothetical protein Btru_032408 [Bulinus truncatus]|nr:hypothetical protein Btru_032408 [Bulinus truncatus]
MSLKVTVVGAENVPNPEAVGKCDPYAVVEFQGHHKKTKVIKGDLNPNWQEIQTVSTYLMTCVFFGVYNMAVDTLFLCFLEDIEMNDGSEQKPYFMSKDLMKILGKHNLSSATRGPHTATVTPDRKGRALPLPKNSSKA